MSPKDEKTMIAISNGDVISYLEAPATKSNSGIIDDRENAFFEW